MNWRFAIPRFSLRTLLLGAVVAALTISAVHNLWWRPLQERAAAVARLNTQGVRVDDLNLNDPNYPTHRRPPPPPPSGSFLAQLLAKDEANRTLKSISFTTSPENATDEDLRFIATLESVEHLDLSRIEIKKFVNSGGGVRIDSHNIGAPDITDAGIAYVAHLPNLRLLHVGQSKVTDRACLLLANSKTLERLVLSGTGITDAGLISLARIPTLQRITVKETGITKAGAERFYVLRPDVQLLPSYK